MKDFGDIRKALDAYDAVQSIMHQRLITLGPRASLQKEDMGLSDTKAMERCLARLIWRRFAARDRCSRRRLAEQYLDAYGDRLPVEVRLSSSQLAKRIKQVIMAHVRCSLAFHRLCASIPSTPEPVDDSPK
jgi:hypothetical protein